MNSGSSLELMQARCLLLVVVAGTAADDVDDDNVGHHQLTTFNHQSKVMVGGKTDDSGNVLHQFRGTISGKRQCRFRYRFTLDVNNTPGIL